MRFKAAFQEGLQPSLSGGLRTDPGFKGSLYDKEISHHEFYIKEVIKDKYEAKVSLVTGKYAEGMLWGPASSLKTRSLIYPCLSWKCRQPCPCHICRERFSLCKNPEHEQSPGGGCVECQDEYWEHFVFHRNEHTSCKYCRHVSSFLPHKRFIVWEVRGYWPESYKVSVDSFVMRHCLSYLKPTGKRSCDVSRELQCDKCDKSFPTDSGLRRHEREKHFEARHACQMCGDQFVRKYKLTIHEKTVHNDVSVVTQNFECELCSEKFTEKGVLERHRKSRQTCSSCDKEFCTLRQSMEHKKNVRDAFSCSGCKKTFRDKDKLRRHQNFKNCDICGEFVCNEQDLMKHKKKHGGESIKCTDCDKVMSSKQRLNEHVRRRTDKPCSRCHKMFCYIADLNAHNIAQHMTEKCVICEGKLLEGTLLSHIKIFHNKKT